MPRQKQQIQQHKHQQQKQQQQHKQQRQYRQDRRRRRNGIEIDAALVAAICCLFVCFFASQTPGVNSTTEGQVSYMLD